MKILITTIILFLTSYACHSQNFDSQYDALIKHLDAEEWIKAEQNCKELLRYTESVDSMQTEKMVLRYIYIYTNAGLLNDKKITKEQALERTKYLQGKELIMPAHPFNSNCYNNCTHFVDEDKNTFFSAVNNKNATQIFSFEYVKVENGIKETKEELEGKFIALKGTLDEISVEGYGLPRFKMKFIHGDYKIEQE